MATFAELAAQYDLNIEAPYESVSMEPRTVTEVTKRDNGALSIHWVDQDGVVKRHTTTQYNPPEIEVGMIVVGGWLDDGYHLIPLPSKK
jgi:hypothetical protein